MADINSICMYLICYPLKIKALLLFKTLGSLYG